MKKGWMFAVLAVVIGLLIVLYLNFIPFALNSFLVFIHQIGYVITYISLLASLFTVIATLLWYPYVRKRFSSPVKHAGISVVRLVLGTFVVIVVIQICLTLFYPSFLYQVSFYLFSVSLVMFAIRNMVNLGAAYAHKRHEKKEGSSSPRSSFPLVTVIVPAYNEEKAIGKTVKALLKLSYLNKEIIIVDDGSTDKTLEIARSYVKDDVLKVLTKPNGGKWDALNTGIKTANGEFIVCIDADTLLDQNAIQHLVKHFEDSKIGAVAGNVKVGNRRGVVTKLQALEYIVGINLFRRSEAYFQKVTVVPGPIGAFRASLLKEVGLFDGDTFAEDADVTLKILKAGYKTVFEPQAIGYTEAPNTMTAVAKQRYRWYRGSLQCLSKHKDMAFNRKYGSAGTFIMPWTIFNGVIYPWFMFFTLVWLLVFCFNPISPYTIYYPRILGGPPAWAPSQRPPRVQPEPPGGIYQFGIAINFFQTIPYIYVFWFFVFLILEVIVAIYAISMDVKERRRLLLYTVLHRLFYMYVVDIIRMLSQLEEAFHYPMKWEKTEHHGTAGIQHITRQ
ncbi:MAG: glycosyltransferase family 2 protein [Candidatus Bathyarchaeia archaeon]